MAQGSMSTAKHLFKDPNIFGLSLIEIALIVLSFGVLCSIFPHSPMFTGTFAAFLCFFILIIKNTVGYFNLIRLPSVVLKKNESDEKQSKICFLVLHPFYSDLVFEQFDQFTNDIAAFLSSISFPLSIQYQRKRINVDEVYTVNNSETLSVKRKKALNSKGPIFKSHIYLLIDSENEVAFLDAINSLGWKVQKIRRDFLDKNYSFNGFRKSNQLHRKKEILHHFEFRELPENIRAKDLSDLLRKSKHDVLWTLNIRRESKSKHIRKLNLRYQQLRKLEQGQASTKIERNLSIKNSLETLESLVRGQEEIYKISSLLTVRQLKQDKYIFPMNVFKNSFNKALFLSKNTLRLFHRGFVDNRYFLPVLITRSDLCRIFPLYLNLYASLTPNNGKVNLFSTYSEALFLSGFQENDAPNGNAVVFGQSGKGKSFFCANLFSSLIEQNPSIDIVLIDTGMGFKGFSKAFNGNTFNMTAQSGEGSGLNFIEFLKLNDDHTERAELLFNFSKLFLEQKLKNSGVPQLNIKQASFLRDLCTEYDIENSTGLIAFYKYLEKLDANNILEDLRLSLKPFCRGNLYGHHFDGNLDRENFSQRVLYFSSPAIASSSDNPLILPYFFVINTLISIRSRLLSSEKRKVIVLWDEVSSLMEIAPEVVSSMWNCMRKTGNSVYCCAQHPEQLSRIKGGEDIIQNSPTRILLGASNQATAIDSIIKLSEAERVFLRDRNPKDPFLLMRENEKYWVKTKYHSLHYDLFTTKKEEVIQKQSSALELLKNEREA